ncbi:glutathionylspermidine synthase [Rubellimicrobium aerolatum]|uniref:Glutathionylspermidine synthase n=1 Tax=Rubellimicrobium aerolatum TaxID=490979 RepID=A0ABW0SH85_9RHOB|nr:glutathionylspermidine synthase [Rubellimicrobium aerolatum]MBP1807457.1 aerotaxis receptor [Rubellimicrobium aerolatum]
MTDSHARIPALTALEGEVPFGFDEMFFSRTDARGVIRSGNRVFQRVSGFAWDRLIGAPHKLVRHPAMPKAVFHLMWDRIKAGLATGAYVRNQSEDGRSYWVFAVIVPLADGYLSVRIKPGSKLLAQVKALYADLLTEEVASVASADSARQLLARLAQAGFPGYDAFQARALGAEVLHRSHVTGRPVPSVAEALATAEAADGHETELDALRAMFDVARMIAINLRIASSELGDLGRPVSAISSNFAVLTDDMTTWLQSRALSGEGGFASIARSLGDGLFLRNAAAILAEMAELFAHDEEIGGTDPAEEAARLNDIAAQYRTRAAASLQRVTREAQGMEARLSEMRTHVSGLNSIRMLCRIEGAVLRRAGGSLDQIVTQLDRFQDEIAGHLARSTELGIRIRRAAAVL